MALALDALIGDPQWLWRRVPHPAVVIGRLISALDRGLNLPEISALQRRALGLVALVLLVTLAADIGFVAESLCRHLRFGSLIIAILASTLLAQRSLFQHVARVRDALKQNGLDAARQAVGCIVGRDPAVLDEPAICRAAIESCAENFSDGVAAPAFWFAVFGLPGLLVYKAVNTADSMIGHRTPRHEAFGWASARFDDLLNLAPARISGLLLCLLAPAAGGHIGAAVRTMWKEASRHRSPNAGWPESAAAGALGVALLGPRHYEGQTVNDPFFNAGGRAAKPDDIARMLRLFLAACGMQLLFYAMLAILI